MRKVSLIATTSLALTVLLLSKDAAASTSDKPSGVVKSLMDNYEQMSTICKSGKDLDGSSIDKEMRKNACNARDDTYREIKKAGWCVANKLQQTAPEGDRWTSCSDKQTSYVATTETMPTFETNAPPGVEPPPKGASKSTPATPPEATENNLYHRCAYLSGVYFMAASVRDMGRSPQEAFFSVSQETHVSEAQKKEIINRVYFNRSFSGVSPKALQQTAILTCMGKIKPYEPLK